MYSGYSQDFLIWGGGGGLSDFFLEKCSLLVDRLGCTSECYIEIEQKKGDCPPFGYAPAVYVT